MSVKIKNLCYAHLCYRGNKRVRGWSLLTCFLALCAHSQVRAAEMYCLKGSDPCSEMYIRGEILVGDYAKFRSILASAEPWVFGINLVSPGGT